MPIKNRIAELMLLRDAGADETPEGDVVEDAIRRQIILLWQTRPLRTEKLFVADEIDNALTYLRDVFLPVVPKLYARWEAELGQRPASFLRVGSWIGGDRDGNPFVTAETMHMATARNAAAVLGHYIDAVHGLGAELSVSASLAAVPEAVEALAEASGDTAPSRRDEPYRRALSGIYARLCATYTQIVGARPPRPSALDTTITVHEYGHFLSNRLIADAAGLSLQVARSLGFEGLCQNSLDAVSDRDFALEFAAFASICMVHVSRLAEELVLWMSQNFGFIDLADRYCTGSSIMPQKRNPDVAELARGKTGRVVGHLMALLTLMKGQPLAYNKDNQEDKEPLFDAVDTVTDTLRIFADMAGGITVKPEAMQAALTQGFATATDLADYLVKKGLPFRDAHEAVGHAVKAAEFKGVDLPGLTLEELQQFSALIENDVYAVLTVEGSLASRNHIGGTAPEQVRAAIQRARNRL